MNRNLIPLIIMALLLTAAVGQNPQTNLVREAEAGSVAAEVKLGRAYQFGSGVPRDMKQAVHWFHKAAHDGNDEAAYVLGTLAYNGDVLGDSIESSLSKAWAWFEVAKVMKYPEAAEALERLEREMSELKIREGHELAAAMFIEGLVIPKNTEAALNELEWLQQHGSSAAQVYLGHMYRTGDGVTKDLAAAKKLCNEALKANAAGAGYCLGRIFDEQGEQRAAFSAIEKDAHLGLVAAVMETAQRLQEGRGTKANPVEALAWMIRAEAGGVTGAAEMRAKFAEGLTEKQLKEAEKKALDLRIILPGAAAFKTHLKK